MEKSSHGGNGIFGVILRPRSLRMRKGFWKPYMNARMGKVSRRTQKRGNAAHDAPVHAAHVPGLQLMKLLSTS